MSASAIVLYSIHAALWISFCAARLFIGQAHRRINTRSVGPTAPREYTAAYSRAFLAFHVCGISIFYLGVAVARLTPAMPTRIIVQRGIGVLITALGASLIGWAIASLRSWRFRAKVDKGHELTTDGAFRLVRHPIYSGMNLAALGTLLWVPTPLVWIGFMLVVIGSDLRARAEEMILHRAFGTAYAKYSSNTKRFVPYVY